MTHHQTKNSFVFGKYELFRGTEYDWDSDHTFDNVHYLCPICLETELIKNFYEDRLEGCQDNPLPENVMLICKYCQNDADAGHDWVISRIKRLNGLSEDPDNEALKEFIDNAC